MKRSIIFRDKEDQRFKIDIELKKNKSNQNVLSISGSHQNGCGQCYDSIIPANKEQKKLVEIWKKYHLNDMKAGTPKQQTILKRTEKQHNYDYNKSCKILDSYNHNLNPINVIEYEILIKKREEEKKTRKELNEKIKKLETEIKEEIKKLKHHCWNKVSSLFLETMKEGTSEAIYNRSTNKDNFKNCWYVNTSHIFFTENEALKKYIKKLEIQLKNRSDKLFYNTLLYDIHPETKKLYKYGSAWLFESLPENIEQVLDDLCNKLEEKTTSNEKIHPLELWLKQTKTKIEINKKGYEKYFLDDKEKRNVYNCLLIRKNYSYTFTFGDSINNSNINKIPKVEEVLYCLETSCPESFEDFCNEYGYSTDSIQDLNIYNAVKEQTEEMQKIFSNKELHAFEDAKQYC